MPTGGTEKGQVVHSPGELWDEMPKLAKFYTWVIADGSAALSETTRATALRTTLAIITCQPTGVDLESYFWGIGLLRGQGLRIKPLRCCDYV